jgi:hypothetical protein
MRDAPVVVHWPELVPSDPIAEREALLLDEQLGVSKDTILEKLGYDPELEREKRALDQAEELAQAQAHVRRWRPGRRPGGATATPVAGGA